MTSEFNTALCYLLEQAFAKVLPVLPKLQTQLQTLTSKTMQISLQDFPVSVVCMAQANGLKVYGQFDDAVDVHLHMRSMDLLKMLLDKQTNLFALDLKVTGDMAVAQAYQQAFNQVHFDVQDLFTTLLGNRVMVDKPKTAWRENSQQCQKQLSKQLVNTVVVDKPSINDFIAQVDQLSAQVDRLSARLEKL